MAVLAGKFTFVVQQGATFDLYIEWKDSSGSLVDLSGYSARMKIKSDRTSSATTYLSLSSSLQSDGTGLSMSGSYLNPIPPSSGSIGIYISAASSSQLDFGSNNEGVYDLEVESSAGYVTRLLEGNVKLSRRVTD